MNLKSVEARKRINNTKSLTLDERVAMVTIAMGNITKDNAEQRGKEFHKWLMANGHEPMMFAHAFRIWLSKKENKP